jgi:transcription elongation factor Elf1
MSKKNLKSKAIKKTGKAKSDTGLEQRKEKIKPSRFHKCTCDECGEDALVFCDFGAYLQSDFRRMTSEGEKGCGHLELEGDYEYVVMCESCGHRIFEDVSCSEEQILDWAIEHGKALPMLDFSCPICGSKTLSEISTGVEISREVVAVCEVSENGEPEKKPLVALAPDRLFVHSRPATYRCSKGHELAKEDGTPVETAEELVEWLKARSASEKG